MEEENEIVPEYDEEEQDFIAQQSKAAAEAAEVAPRGTYSGIHCSGFRDFLLKPELLKAITDCGFEHPSEVQQKCIPKTCLGTDVICQAKSGMGKTAVFVLSILHQIKPIANQTSCIVIAHSRELAFQICHEFERFAKYLPDIKTTVVFGGLPISKHIQLFAENKPHIVVGCPGRIKDLIKRGVLTCDNIEYFVVDECDRVFQSNGMRFDVQEIFSKFPASKQVMMFSATLPEQIRSTCLKFMRNPQQVFVDDDKLTLDGLQQYYLRLLEKEKNRKLCEFLDILDFNQLIIFVNSKRRCEELNLLLTEHNFPSICIHGALPQEDRIARYQSFKVSQKRILVATELFGRGMDITYVNIVINYDMPSTADDYLHRVGRAGRFGTKGLCITFISSQEDANTLGQIQERFEVEIPELPEQIASDSYMNN